MISDFVAIQKIPVRLRRVATIKRSLLKVIAIVAALTVSRIASATPIDASFAVEGAATYTYSFSSASLGFAPPDNFVVPPSGSTLSPYFTLGQAITFTQGPYSIGPMGTVTSLATPAMILTSTENGETLSFFITDYTAEFIGSLGAIIDFDGHLTETGTVNYAQTAGKLSLAVSRDGASSSFTAIGHTEPTAVTPEPISFSLVGMGLVSVAGMMVGRRKE